MYACLCRAVSERAVSQAVRAGCTDVEELAARCGAGSACGGCIPQLEAMLVGVGHAVESIRSSSRSVTTAA